MSTTYRTHRAYFSGGLCGRIWMPDTAAGTPFHDDAGARFARFSDPRGATFRDALLSALMEKGGDFQSAKFTADTELIVERIRVHGPGRMSVHTRRWPVADLPDCGDLVDPECFSWDFNGADDE